MCWWAGKVLGVGGRAPELHPGELAPALRLVSSVAAFGQLCHFPALHFRH